MNNMKSRIRDIDKRWKELAMAGCVCILFFVCITHLSGIFRVIGGFFKLFSPVVIGAVIAYIVNPLANFFSDKVFRKIKKEKPRWTLSALIAIIIIVAILGLLMAMMVPQLIDNVASLLDNIDDYIANLSKAITRMGLPFGSELSRTLVEFSGENGALTKLLDLVQENLNTILRTTSNIGSAAVNWLIGAVIAVYLLLAKFSILAAFRRLFSLAMKPLTFTRTKLVMEKFHTIFSKYIVCELVDSLIIGGANFIFMMASGMPDALFVSVIMALTNLAPTFGPIVGAGIGGFILLLLKPRSVILFLIFTLVLQTVDGYFIKPKLFGGVLNVPGVLILIAIIVFGRLLGVIGMLIAIPAAAILVYVYSEVLIPWLELRRDLKEFRREEGKKPEKPEEGLMSEQKNAD